MPPSTARSYLLGETGSYRCRTIREVERHIRDLHGQLADASPEHRARLWGDIDRLMDRRKELVEG